MSPCLYRRVLGSDWERLPQALRQLHEVSTHHVYAGTASVENGRSLLARCCRVVMRFPPAASSVPVQVLLRRDGECERWTRSFGSHQFDSVLSRPADGEGGIVTERFGPLNFRLTLSVGEQGLEMPVRRAYFLGIPLPGFLTPRSQTREFVDAQGRYSFDVAISLPGIGLIVRYRGWLMPV